MTPTPLLPYIPEYITVHLGAPNTPADNVTVSFPDYIKNVASSEIYPTWPESALRANIYAQTSFALNRIYTEWYRSRGYDFDITNSTAYDQSFVYGRDIFDNISNIVDSQFNSYIRRQGRVEPLLAAYCDGVEVVCNGLLKVGTVPLANEGYSPLEILRYYYGDDIELVTDAPVELPTPSYPGIALRLGDVNNDVLLLQIRLNRIAKNYPAIPQIYPVNGFYDSSTQEAVRAFQRVFGLTEDGVVGPATWYRIAYLYASVKRLAELDSEGLQLEDISPAFPEILRPGDTGRSVREIQYFLAVVAEFYPTVPPVEITGVFDGQTENAVRSFQQSEGLTVDGIVGLNTWRALYSIYREIEESGILLGSGVAPFPGEPVAIGDRGEDVRTLQTYLSRISQSIAGVPAVTVDGVFGPRTEEAVRAVQRLYGLEENGSVG
ncbi:MAG: peptidoglycan-binding protein, partial [Clostridia bacterium]|nr:peptidoglycan-binding protein [Clostridia bacterium]